MISWRTYCAEFIGSTVLLAVVVGSGIMGVRLADGNDGIALLANAAATSSALYVLIVLLGPISGAHFNPAVTIAVAPRLAVGYVPVQVVGAVCGVFLAHAMFGEAIWQPGIRERTGGAQWLSEAVATFGLLFTIVIGARLRPAALPALVAAWIFAAYWFTASTSFANPAVTFARALTQSFSGIRPEDAGPFVVAQIVGATCGALAARWISASVPKCDATS